jgi:hypothetical protein
VAAPPLGIRPSLFLSKGLEALDGSLSRVEKAFTPANAAEQERQSQLKEQLIDLNRSWQQKNQN